MWTSPERQSGVWGTSGALAESRYRPALEASRGGSESMMDVISTGPLTMGPSLTAKLGTGTDTWSTTYDNSIIIDANAPATYDMTVDLGVYRVYVKVVDTVVGNTGLSTGLLKSGVVSTSPSEISGMAIPYLYTVEVLSQSTANPTERSKISFLYQY